ncbi:MAG: zinc protease [Rhodocyclales bacterium RIFCSPLOWO2_02_FULL_63_24]|nr:MAG: zinc protease [Rhodocyclales bacterium RIFCSPLOWO2_02_FULL_63_24]
MGSLRSIIVGCSRTRFTLICLLTSLASSLTLAGVKIEHWVAPSGAKVYFVETRVLPILDVQIDFAAGAAFVPAAKSGLAGLTQSLLEAGAADLDEEHIAGRLVDIGARLGGGADSDRASLSLRTLSAKTEREAALDLMRTVLSAPTFPQSVLEREKGRAIASIREAETRPDAIAGKRFAAAIYPDHPYGVSPTVDSVAAITREDLAAFHRQHYGAKGAVVSIIGDVSRAEAEAIAQRLTESLPAGGGNLVPPAVKKPQRGTLKVAHPAAQSHVHIGLPAIRRSDADYFPLLVGNYTLGGGGFVSRLMKEVREKRGYAYSVYSYFSPRKLEGPFEIGLQTKREQVGDALKVVDAVLTEYMAKGPTPKELAAAKKNMVDGLALRMDSNAKLLGYLSAIGFYELPLTYLDDFPAKVNAVTAEQVKAAFARHVKPENLVTVVVAAD